MHKDIISQNIKLIDTKMIINEIKFEMIEKVEYCINSDMRLEKAWIILQRIYKFRDESTAGKASDELIKIIEELEKSEIHEMVTIGKTYRHWFKEICNSFLTYKTYNKKKTLMMFLFQLHQSLFFFT